MEKDDDQQVSGLFAFLLMLGSLVAYFYALRGSEYGWEDIRSALLIWLLFILFAAFLEFALWLVAVVMLVGVIYMEFRDHPLVNDIDQAVALVGVASCSSAISNWPESSVVGYICPQTRLARQTDLAVR